MSQRELMKAHRIKTNVNDLDTDERERYEAFVALGENDTDRRILSNTWLKHHAAMSRV